MKVNLNITFTFLLLCAIELHAFIIPDEIPSILSIIYSNIPTLKKGTDSRMGWGFRLGNRADFQIITELGPQINTQKLANQEENNPNKRNTLNNLANTLYAQKQQEKKENKRPNKTENSTSDKDEENWLTNWSKNVAKKNLQPEKNNDVLKNVKPGLGIGEIDAKSVIPEDPDDKKAH